MYEIMRFTQWVEMVTAPEAEVVSDAASDAAMEVLKPITDAATPTETRLIEQELSAAISCALGAIRIRKALDLRDKKKPEDAGLVYAHHGTAKLDGAPRRIRNPR